MNTEMMALSFDSHDGGILSVDSHRVVPAPFLTKTYQLVDDPVTNDIVSWGEDGSTFVVWRPPEFARDLLPNYFKHNNFSSFVRQLNTYGFRKVVPDRWEFANDFFRKGERHLLCEIHRRKAQQSLAHFQHYGSPTLSPTTSGEDPQLSCTPGTWSPLSSSPLPSPRAYCTAGASTPASLSDENERLRRDNCLLLSELARLQKMYDDALLFLQQNMRLCVDDLRLSSCKQVQQQLQQQQTTQFLLQRHHHRLVQAHESSMSLEPQQQQQQQQRLLGNRQLSDGVTPKASTIDFVDGKLKELNAIKLSSAFNSNSNNGKIQAAVEDPDQSVQRNNNNNNNSKSEMKLFGVLLPKKRLHSDHQQQEQTDEVEEVSARSFQAKSAKIELELMPSSRAASAAAAVNATEAPWLKFSTSRDERVCI